MPRSGDIIVGEDFTVQGSPMAMDDDDMEITVEYKSAKTDLADVDGWRPG